MVDDHVLGYIATLVRKTRQWPTFSLGASPRAGVAILRGARAVAALEGRDYILPDDVQDVRPACLATSRHAHARGRDRGPIRRRTFHRADQVRRGPTAMKMIWPGRVLGVALMVPALFSLALFVSEVGLATGAGLRRSGRCRGIHRSGHPGGSGPVACRAASWTSLFAQRAPGSRALDRKRGRRRRTLRLRDDVPDDFLADPAAFDVTVPGRRQAILTYQFVPKRRGTYVFEQIDALVDSRLGFWRGQCSWPLRTEVRVYPNIHQVARFTMLARRDRLSTLGLRRSRRLGTDNEFERLRDYIEGDDPRHHRLACVGTAAAS